MNIQQQNLFDSSSQDVTQTRKPNVAHSEETREARGISYDNAKQTRSKRHLLILECLAGFGPQTARQILRRLIEQGHLPTTAERNQISPRASEMLESGLIDTLEDLRTVGNDPPASVFFITERGQVFLDERRREAQKNV